MVPATWEAKAGESLEPRRQRLWLAEIAPLHSSLVIEKDSIKKKGRKEGRREGGRKEGKKEGKRQGRKEGRKTNRLIVNATCKGW